MERKQKIELINGIANGGASIYDILNWVFIVQKDGKNYISDGQTIGHEISDSELYLIKCPKIFIDEDDLGL
jgi:hypothetical protein